MKIIIIVECFGFLRAYLSFRVCRIFIEDLERDFTPFVKTVVTSLFEYYSILIKLCRHKFHLLVNSSYWVGLWHEGVKPDINLKPLFEPEVGLGLQAT